MEEALPRLQRLPGRPVYFVRDDWVRNAVRARLPRPLTATVAAGAMTTMTGENGKGNGKGHGNGHGHGKAATGHWPQAKA